MVPRKSLYGSLVKQAFAPRWNTLKVYYRRTADRVVVLFAA